MSQTLKRVQRVNSPYHHMLSIIDIGKAAHVMLRMLKGETVTVQQDRTAIAIFNKIVPSTQAISVQIEDSKPQHKSDIDNMLMQAGIDPDDTWATIEGESIQLQNESE